MQSTSTTSYWAETGSQLPADHTPSRNSGTASLWLTYTCLAAWPSIACGAAAVLLHQLTCQLSTEPTHWAVAALICGLCFVLALAVVAATNQRWSSVAMTAVVIVVSTAGLFTWEHCQAHLFALYALISFSFVLMAASVHNRRNAVATTEASGSGGLDEMDVQGESVIAPEDQVEGLPQEALTRPFWSRYAVAIVLASAAFIYLVAVPTVSMIQDLIWPSTASIKRLTDMTIAESVRLHAVSVAVMLIFLAAGASIGSFLNVVIFRLPRRRPLFLPSSACPNCQEEISGIDNIPVLAWLRLGGKCRNCSVPISARYPIIEAVVGLVFVIFYFRELLSGGANLPVRTENTYSGIVWILLYTKWDLLSLYFFHMIVLVTLLAWGMINYDQFRVPLRSGLCAIGLAAILVSLFGHLNPITPAWKDWGSSSIPASLVVTLLGGLVGLAASPVLWFLSPRSTSSTAASGDLVDVSASAAAKLEAVAGNTEQDEARDQVTHGSESGGVASGAGSLGADECEGEQSDVSVEGAPANELYGGAAREPNDRANVAFSLALVGVACGYETVLLVLAVAAVVSIICQIPLVGGLPGRVGFGAARSWPATLWIFTSTILVLVFWRDSYQLFTSYIYSALGVV